MALANYEGKGKATDWGSESSDTSLLRNEELEGKQKSSE